MSQLEIIEHFKRVDLPDPVDVVIQQTKDLLHTGVLKPGDKLLKILLYICFRCVHKMLRKLFILILENAAPF